MTDTTPNYYDMRIEDTWMDYLRARLPYSFNHIKEQRKGASRYFVLSEPELLPEPSAATLHNFWRRGNVYYMSGKLLDFNPISQVLAEYKSLEVVRLLSGPSILPLDAFTFYNSLQFEKVWGFAQSNHLDRERVMMTNIVLAVELCLKAVMTHASFRESNCFTFSAGHSIDKLYQGLPSALRDEVTIESEVFAKDYVAFRAQVETEIREIYERCSSHPQAHLGARKQAETDWSEVARKIMENSYTAFVNSNDPGVGDKYLHEGWFKEALNQVESIEEPGDISQYFRYAPHEDKDELPTDLIHWILLLGRFLYEHLFPVARPDDRPFSGLPVSIESKS